MVNADLFSNADLSNADLFSNADLSNADLVYIVSNI